MIKVYIFIILSAIISSSSQVCFKTVANKFENVSLRNHMHYFKSILFMWLTWVGFIFVFLDVITWTIVLNFTELSFAFPFCALNYIIILLPSKFLLKEKISGKRLLGTALIMAGIILVGLTQGHHQ